jgi:hypothetical protein
MLTRAAEHKRTQKHKRKILQQFSHNTNRSRAAHQKSNAYKRKRGSKNKRDRKRQNGNIRSEHDINERERKRRKTTCVHKDDEFFCHTIEYSKNVKNRLHLRYGF